jgi:hypothetical protein
MGQRHTWRPVLLAMLVTVALPPGAAVRGDAGPGDAGAPGTAYAGVPAGSGAAARGRNLFEGAVALRGTIAGHASELPPPGARCINCHAAGLEPAAQPAASFGPALTRRQLTQALPRRGGPPSRYDEATFCRLLRTGIDPAYVLITRSMPRYELPDEDCRALWAYLAGPQGAR